MNSNSVFAPKCENAGNWKKYQRKNQPTTFYTFAFRGSERKKAAVEKLNEENGERAANILQLNNQTIAITAVIIVIIVVQISPCRSTSMHT